MAHIGSASGPLMLVVVTGVPGAGKTTLASALARELGASFLSLDSIKEDLFARRGDLQAFALRRAAEGQLADHLSAATGPVVVDIWIAPRLDTERVGRLLRRQGTTIVEVLCRVPADVAVERYLRRRRGEPHLPPGEATLRRISEAVDILEPMGTEICVEVDTSRRSTSARCSIDCRCDAADSDGSRSPVAPTLRRLLRSRCSGVW